MTHEKFVEQLEGYLKHIRAAYGYFDAYEAIITAYYNNFEKISTAPGFFTVARCSLYNSMLMELAKLYCTRNQSPERTLSKLLNLLQDNRHLFRAEDDIKGLIEEAKVQLANMESEIHILAKRRDKYMAHNDPMCFDRDFNPGKEMFLGKDLLIKVKWKFQNIEFEKKGIRNQAAEQFKIERAAGQGGIWYRFRPVSVCLDKQLPRRNKYAGTC